MRGKHAAPIPDVTEAELEFAKGALRTFGLAKLYPDCGLPNETEAARLLNHAIVQASK